MSATPVHRRKTRVSLSTTEKKVTNCPAAGCRAETTRLQEADGGKKTTHERSVWLIVINDASLINLTHQQEIIFSAS
jgi:hypothetical protein